jgi:hypothetical protein
VADQLADHKRLRASCENVGVWAVLTIAEVYGLALRELMERMGHSSSRAA